MINERRDTIEINRGKNNPMTFSRAANDLASEYDDPAAGRIRIGQVVSIDTVKKIVDVYVLADQSIKQMILPGFMTDPTRGTGLWYGLNTGDIVQCHMGFSNIYYITNKIGHYTDSLQDIGISQDGMYSLFFDSNYDAQDTDLSKLEVGSFLIKSENDTKIKLSPSNGAFIGKQRSSSINLDTSSFDGGQSGSATFESNQIYLFNNSGYSINGVVLRDNRAIGLDSENDSNLDERIISRWYKNLSTIGFEPNLKISEETSGSRKRNPPLVENRNVVYEFSDYTYDNIIQSDEKEAKKQNPNNPKFEIDKTTSRRIRKEDVLSLSLVSPNYLIEKIEGTLVDVYGNILDINRTILPIGEEDGFITLDETEENYYKVRELYRKSVAFHLEMNARKDPNELNIETGTGDEYANIDGIYKRNRSRLFLDIDKEGQFKLNIPSSSETGNVPVLARYENYTTINPKEKDKENDYDYFRREKDVSTDVLLDGFGVDACSLSGNKNLLPNDRITGEPIKVGTAFHNIAKTCVVPEYVDEYHATGILSGPDTEIDDANGTRNILNHTGGTSIITQEIIIDGDNANAGGRSGTAVFDGMINVSIGSNTIDRQSLWLDTAGGIVSRVGADLNGISMATQTDGDVYLQIGGEIIGEGQGDPDKRFSGAEVIDTSSKTNRFEIRVMQGNGPSYTRILIDNEGIIICSPKNIEFRAEEDIVFGCNGNIFLNTEKIVTYGYTSKDDTTRFTRQSRKFDEVFEADQGARVLERGLDRRTI